MGSRIVGKVRNLTEFGAFVEVEEDIDGLIHISDMSWSKRIKHPSEVLKKGDKVEAVVLNIDAENQRLSLGLKQLATDVWDDFFTHHQVGDTVEGKVVRLTNFGAFVELAEGIEGLIHVSEFDDSQGGEKIDLQVDQTYPMKIIKLSPAERKIGLSIRAMRVDQDRADWQSLRGEQRRRRLLDDRRSPEASVVTLVDPSGSGDRGSRRTFPTPILDPNAFPRRRRATGPSRAAPAGQHDQGRSRRRSVARLGPHQETLGSDRRHASSRASSTRCSGAKRSSCAGFGSFRLRKREPRKGRNPKTGDRVDVPPKKVPYFKPGKELKDLINREMVNDRRTAARRYRPDISSSNRCDAWNVCGRRGDWPTSRVRARRTAASSATRSRHAASPPGAFPRRKPVTSSSTCIPTTTAT